MQTSEKLTLSREDRVYMGAKYTRFRLSRGSFVDTVQDRCDLFYIDHEDDDFCDRRAGYHTRAEALNAIGRRLMAR